ncbi:MAG TPA: AmmeMemoRadiSam system protein A [Candidatus Polarisedimenticolaceae bacterium]|nr:AmmeMemoRadiSam system protein A [Candidatus Polarisedimenticolaceae bacterium]
MSGGLLTATEGAALVRLARAAIEDRLLPRDAVAAVLRSIELTPGLLEPRGVFVTLHAPEGGRRRLRGCIGSTEAESPAHEAVLDAAVHAAFRDPRFPPLTPEEYPLVDVSVSVLTLPRVVTAENVVPGEDGVILEHPQGRAIFLPEVAAEHGWSREDLLVQLCRKARVPEGAWREATLFSFRSQKFGE